MANEKQKLLDEARRYEREAMRPKESGDAPILYSPDQVVNALADFASAKLKWEEAPEAESAAPLVAHSKSEYKRMKAMGAENVELSPAVAPRGEQYWISHTCSSSAPNWPESFSSVFDRDRGEVARFASGTDAQAFIFRLQEEDSAKCPPAEAPAEAPEPPDTEIGLSSEELAAKWPGKVVRRAEAPEPLRPPSVPCEDCGAPLMPTCGGYWHAPDGTIAHDSGLHDPEPSHRATALRIVRTCVAADDQVTAELVALIEDEVTRALAQAEAQLLDLQRFSDFVCDNCDVPRGNYDKVAVRITRWLEAEAQLRDMKKSADAAHLAASNECSRANEWKARCEKLEQALRRCETLASDAGSGWEQNQSALAEIEKVAGAALSRERESEDGK